MLIYTDLISNMRFYTSLYLICLVLEKKQRIYLDICYSRVKTPDDGQRLTTPLYLFLHCDLLQ